jgi:hypothetical protein
MIRGESTVNGLPKAGPVSAFAFNTVLALKRL